MPKVLSLTPLVIKNVEAKLPKHMKHANTQISLQSIRKAHNRAIDLDGFSIIRAIGRINKK